MEKVSHLFYDPVSRGDNGGLCAIRAPLAHFSIVVYRCHSTISGSSADRKLRRDTDNIKA